MGDGSEKAGVDGVIAVIAKNKVVAWGDSAREGVVVISKSTSRGRQKGRRVHLMG